jgi:rod shape-determining protein MreC
MRLLFLLLWRNNFTILFLLLQVLSITMLVRSNRYQQATFLNASNQLVTATSGAVQNAQEFVSLRDENAKLATENAKLRARLSESLYIRDTITVRIQDTIRFQQYEYMPAKVVNNSVNRRNNYITLNRGSLDGIRPEMGVITSNGVVGIVHRVSKNYCTVISLLNEKTSVSAMISRNRFFGSVRWDGKSTHRVTLYEIDKTVPVRKGDSVVTTNYSALFPSGIYIGKVDHIAIEPGSPFYKLGVKLATDFSNLSSVYIVKNLFKDEQRMLEVKNDLQEVQP